MEIINTDEEKKIQDTINKEMRYMGLMCVIRLKNVKKLIYTTAIKLLVIFTWMRNIVMIQRNRWIL